MEKDKNIDKYLKVSDQLVYLFHHQEDFIIKFNAPKDSDPEQTINNEVKIMILNIQEDTDHDDIAKVLIEHNRHDLLMELLQQDNSALSILKHNDPKDVKAQDQ